MDKNRKETILNYLKVNSMQSSSDVLQGMNLGISLPTLKRDLAELVNDNYIEVKGRGKASRYSVTPQFGLFFPINIEEYFIKEIDERTIYETYNFGLLDLLNSTPLFTNEEIDRLNTLQADFKKSIAQLPEALYKKDMERLAIDLSWKSSQIEGNTYSLLETEQLLKEKKTAAGKSKDEAIMLLNHKDALDFILETPDYLEYLTVSKIENIHRILVKELNVDKNLRIHRVGITGTNYKPLDNEFQIREALESVCSLVNDRTNVFEKALLLLLLISYIQPFNDGNKRTSRIVSNAQFIAADYCPISFRTVDSVDYKKAMLLFYEQNNLSAFKRIFIEQFEFAVRNYF